MPHRPLIPGIDALRESRDLRLLLSGEFVSSVGTQMTLVALPYQVYVETRSAFLTGLLGAVELGPMIAVSLVAGAYADRIDRRRLLLWDQIALVLVAAALFAVSLSPEPSIVVLFALAALMAAAGSLQNVARQAMVPNLVSPARLRSALALSFGLTHVSLVFGPALGGAVIATTGVKTAYLIDAVSCAGMVLGVWRMRPQPPHATEGHLPLGQSIAEGLRFVRSNRPLLGSFLLDLNAMAFGMPRALFPVLAVSVYGAGAEGTGLLFAAVSVGSTVAALTTGWLDRVERLGLIVIAAIVAWGLAIAAAGLVASLWAAAGLLALAGAADSVSSVCRSTINQTVTPDALRGRMSSVYMIVVTSGPRLGDVEAGSVAAVTSPQFSVVSGGLACIAGVGLVVLAFPQLLRYRAPSGAPVAEAEEREPQPTAT